MLSQTPCGCQSGKASGYCLEMKRVIILGPGASGKSTFAKQLGELTRLPVTELAQVFWRSGLVATPPDEWANIQRSLVQANEWILDGDLGCRTDTIGGVKAPKSVELCAESEDRSGQDR